MDKKQEQLKKEQKETMKLIGILSIGVFILLILSIVLMNNMTIPTATPEPKYIDIDNIEGMNLVDAKALLEKAGITYEIIPTESKLANKVEKLEFVGVTLTDTGRLRIRIGTTVKIYGNEVANDKVIYLTFDDGPTRDNTIDILNTLDTYGIKATFFVQGKNVANYPDRIVETVNRGHLVGCHSHTHEISQIYTSISNFTSEIKLYEDAMKNAIGEENFNAMNKVIRFPGGTTTNSMLTKAEALEYISSIREIGYRVYDWTSLTGDAEGKKTAQEFIEYMSTTLDSSKNANKPLIVLLHDKWSTNEALGEILDYLIEQGYYFDTIDNCPEYTFAENK